jgi:hypothetical protein
LHHHKKAQGLGKHEKVLIMDKKNELLIRVKGTMRGCEKKRFTQAAKCGIFTSAAIQNHLPTLLYLL